MDYDPYDIGIDLKDPNFQEKILEKGMHDIFIGWVDGLYCVFIDSVLSGWLQKIFCAVFLLLAHFSNQLDSQHPVVGPVVGFSWSTFLPFRTPASSLIINVLGRVAGAILLELIQLMWARVADRNSAVKGMFLVRLEPLVALAVMIVFRLSFRLGIVVCVILPAASYFIIPLSRIFIAIVKRLPYPVRMLTVLPLLVFDKCHKWLQYRLFPSFYRFLDRIEHDRLQKANTELLRHNVYRYTPLTSRGHFRVLVVGRRRLFRPPKCRLEVESLDRSSAHIACSYVWGDATRWKPIAIGPYRLDITESAYNVVCHQQSFWAERRIWIDAICINQSDLREKAVQIEHMGEIYGHALWVDGYLKFGNEDSDLWVLINDLLNKDAMHQAFNASDHELIYQEHLQPYWSRLFDMLASPWFNRMWVMQEIMLAGDLYLNYGQVRLTWPVLGRLVNAMDTAILRTSFAGRRLFTRQQAQAGDIGIPLRLVITRRILKRHEESLFTLLRFFHEQKATDPRDKIYGLLSLAPYNVRTFLGPAYQITLYELLIRTMRYIILKDGLICLLSCRHEPDHPLANQLPSWVINWCVGGQTLDKADIPSWKAAAQVQPLPYDIRSCPITSKTLPVRMMPVVDRVGETVAIRLSKDNISIESADEYNSGVHTWLTRGRDIALRSSPRNDLETVQRLKQAFYRTLTYDHEDADNETTLGWSYPDFQSDIDFLEDWFNVGGDFEKSRVARQQRRVDKMLQPVAEKTGMSIRQIKEEATRGNLEMFKGLKNLPDDDEDDREHKTKRSSVADKDTARDLERVAKIQERLRFSLDRRTGVTMSGRIGSFPQDAREGDEICLIAGAPAPLVVRKRAVASGSDVECDNTDSGRTDEVPGYQLVGWCYLHSGMDGSLATGPWIDTYLI